MTHKRFPIQILRSFWLPQIHNIEGLPQENFKSWLIHGYYSFDTNPTGNRFHLYISDENKFTSALSSDISRMAAACFESIYALRKTPKVPKSTAWLLIRLYYAAFFAAHVSLRIFGISCSHLDRGHIDHLKQYADTLGYSWSGNVSKGFFVCRYDSDKRILSCMRMNDTHADTWKTFYSYLKELSNVVLSAPGLSAQRNMVSTLLSDIAMTLENQGVCPRGNWLSQFRNRLNYQHDYGAWFPYKNAQISYIDIERNLKQWNCDLSCISLSRTRTKEVSRFIETCIALVALCNSLLDDIQLASSSKRSFLEFSSLAFLRISRMI